MLKLLILKLKFIWKANADAFGFASTPLTAIAPVEKTGGCR